MRYFNESWYSRNMQKSNIDGYRTLDGFIRAKLARLEKSEKSFQALYELMFSERENIMFEQSVGYKIVYTTYGECRDSIDKRSKTLSCILSDLPLGSIVGIYMNNSRDWIEMLWAVLRCGYRPLLMNLRLDKITLGEAISTYDVGAVIVDRDVDFGVRTIRCEEITQSDEKPQVQPFGSELLVMSSGTSSHLKICAYTAKEIAAQIVDSCAITRKCPAMKRHYKGQLKQLVFLPFYHIFGLAAVYIWFAFFSRTFVLLNDMTPQTILNTIRRHNVTHIFAVPMLWDKVYESACRTIRGRGEKTWIKFCKGLKLANAVGGIPILRDIVSHLIFKEVRDNLFGPSIRFMISGGSEIRPCVLEFMNGIGYHLANGYGMTEIGITSVELSCNKKLLNSCSVGKPLSSVEYKLGDGGELFVRGKTLAKAVWRGGVKAENDGGWFDTGDIAACKSGRYCILGRRDDLVIAPSGENLNPNIIEQRLYVPGIRGLCLVGIRDGASIQPVVVVSVKAYISSKQLRDIRTQLLQKIHESGLSGLISRAVFVTDALMNPDDIKLNRSKIARRLQNGDMTVANPDLQCDESCAELEEYLRECFAQALDTPLSDITCETDFFADGGGSSLDYFSMISRIQEELGVSLMPDSAGQALGTVAQISKYIRETDERG